MPSLLLSVDVEDWHQLLAGRLGLPDPDPPGPAFPRQMHAILDLFDELGASGTFFMLGKTVERYPEIAREIVERGHEPASHGYSHDRVYDQTESEFRADVERSIEVIERLTGRRPLGYRAPAFSIDRTCLWAYEVLAELGFAYDSSQHDSPRLARRPGGIPAGPYRLRLPSGAELDELPIAVAGRLPVGGGSYWRLLPAFALRRGLRTNPGVSNALLPPLRVRPPAAAGPAARGVVEAATAGALPAAANQPRAYPRAGAPAQRCPRARDRRPRKRRDDPDADPLANRRARLTAILGAMPADADTSTSERVQGHFEEQAGTFDALYDEERGFQRLVRPGLFHRRELTLGVVREYDSPRVLDVGCGSGRIAEPILEAGAGEYVGIDFSEPMLELAGQRLARFGDDRVQLVTGDFLAQQLEGKFDVIVGLGLFDYLPNPEAFAHRMREVAADGGSVVASFPRWTWFKGPIRKVRYEWINDCPIFNYTEPQLRGIFSDAGFASVEIERPRRSGYMLRARA